MKIIEEVGINCSYVPPELIAAAGYSPRRLWPEGIGGKAREVLPVNYCPYSRAILSEIYDDDSKVILASSCDAMRRVYDIKYDSGFLLEVPRRNSPQFVNFFVRKLEETRNFLGGFNNLQEKIIIYNQCRELMKELRDNLLDNNRYSFALLVGALYHYYNHDQEWLQKLVDRTAVVPGTGNGGVKKPGVVISSSCLLDTTLIDLMEEVGFRIMGLDSCLGERAFDFSVQTEGNNLLLNLAESYLKKPACPRMLESEKRLAYIRHLISRRNAEGLIYFIPKFCDQASYDFKYLKEWAIETDFPMLMVEGEYRSGESGQLKTRIEAFRESLQLQLGFEV